MCINSEVSFSEFRVLGTVPLSLQSTLSSSGQKHAIQCTLIFLSVPSSHENSFNLPSSGLRSDNTDGIYQLDFTENSTGRRWTALADKWSRTFPTKYFPILDGSSATDENRTLSQSSSASEYFTWLLVRKDSWVERNEQDKERKAGLTSRDDIKDDINDECAVKCFTSKVNEMDDNSDKGKELPLAYTSGPRTREDNQEEEQRLLLLDILHFLAPKPRRREEISAWFHAKQAQKAGMVEPQQTLDMDSQSPKGAINQEKIDCILRRWTKTEKTVTDATSRSVYYELIPEGFLHVNIDRYEEDDTELRRQVANRGIKALASLERTSELAETLWPYADRDILLASSGGIMSGLGVSKVPLRDGNCGTRAVSPSFKESQKRLREDESPREGENDEDNQANNRRSKGYPPSGHTERALYASMEQCPVQWNRGDLMNSWGTLQCDLRQKGNQDKKETDSCCFCFGSKKGDKNCGEASNIIGEANNLELTTLHRCSGNHSNPVSATVEREIKQCFRIPSLELCTTGHHLQQAVRTSQCLAKAYLHFCHALLAHEDVTAKAAAWRKKHGCPWRCTPTLNEELEKWWMNQERPREALEEHLSELHNQLYQLERDVAEYVFMTSLVSGN